MSDIIYRKGYFFPLDSKGNIIGNKSGYASDAEAREFLDDYNSDETNNSTNSTENDNLRSRYVFANGKKSKSSEEKLLKDEPNFSGVVYRISRYGRDLDPRCWKQIKDARLSAQGNGRSGNAFFYYYRFTYHNGKVIKKELLDY